MYFNYHAKIKRLINEEKLIKVEIVEKYNNISPAMVLYFKDNPPMPIREYKWSLYFEIIRELNLNIDIKY